jgi:serine/threonine-protein kinase
MEPKKIGRYEIIELIGRGGMAAVYRAFDPNFKREVAIKVLPAKFLSDPTFRSRFDREAHTIAQLEHPTIVPVYDYGEDQEQPFIVMRLMPGRSLADRLANGPMPIPAILQILRRLAEGLDFAHQKGVIHRDLKPGNILFDKAGYRYLSDFGIARLAGSASNLTDGAIIGTPAYISPEQGLGSAAIDARSDLYSLGVMAFEMLTGRLPFEGDAATDQILKHISQPVPKLVDFNPDLPAAIQAVIEHMMDKDPGARYPSAVAMVDELAKAANVAEAGASTTTAGEVHSIGPASRPTGPSNPTPGRISKPNLAPGARITPTTQPRHASTQPRKKSGIGWLAPFLVSLLAITAIAMGGLVFWPKIAPALGFTTNAPDTTQVANKLIGNASDLVGAAVPLESPIMQGENPTKTPEQTSTEKPTLTPTDQSTLAAAATLTPAPGRPVVGGADRLAFVKDNVIYAMNMDGSDFQAILDRGGNKFGLQWTPNGQAITYISGKCVEMVNVDTKKQESIFCASWANSLDAFEISPDGQYVAISLSNGLFILYYDEINLSQITRPEQLDGKATCVSYKQNKTKSVRWATDNSHIATVVNTTDSTGRQVELVRLLRFNGCGQSLTSVFEIPGKRDEINEYEAKPSITSFGFDGSTNIFLNVDRLNGFGQVYGYKTTTRTPDELYLLGIDPQLGTRCCFRDYRWSPDGGYLLFTFQDYNVGKGMSFYYVKFGSLGTGETYTPLPLPADLANSLSDQRLEPVLRKAQAP